MLQKTFNPQAGVMPQYAGVAVPLEGTRILWQHELGFLGVELEDKQNAVSSRVVCVIRTDQEYMIAKAFCRVLGLG
jgi:hypothetical protein